MNRQWLIASSVLGLGLMTLPHVAAQRSPAAQLAQANGWYATLEPARAQAQRTGKPLMVVFRCEP